VKNKFLKVSLIFVSIITILILSNKYIIQKVQADSGWDSSYDGGSSSSSFDNSSSSNSNSISLGTHGFDENGKMGLEMRLLISLFMTLHYFVFFIIPFSKMLSKGNYESRNKCIIILLMIRLVLIVILDIIFPALANLDVILLFVLMFICLPLMIRSTSSNRIKNYNQITQEEANKVTPNFNIEEFNFKAYQIFYDVQIAWMNFDYDKLKELLTDELYNTYLMDLEALKVKNQKNTMKDFELKETKLISLKEENNTYIAEILLSVKFYDYIEDINTSKILRGTNNRKLYNTYVITFIKSKEEAKVKYCPRCGAKVEGNQTGVCKYCNSKLINKSYDWIISKKEKIDQR